MKRWILTGILELRSAFLNGWRRHWIWIDQLSQIFRELAECAFLLSGDEDRVGTFDRNWKKKIGRNKQIDVVSRRRF
jgi:hypothetical protein